MKPCVLCNSIWKNAIIAVIGASFVFGLLVSGTASGDLWGLCIFGGIAVLFSYRAITVALACVSTAMELLTYETPLALFGGATFN